MSRVPHLTPSEFTRAQAELYALYATGPRAHPDSDFLLVDARGQLIGPPAAWMLNAQLGLSLEHVGREIRFNLGLTPRIREIVILIVAEAEDSDFERFAHERAAAKAGLSTDEVCAIADATFASGDEKEGLAAELAAVLTSGQAITDGLWQRATAQLGATAVFEIVTLVGYYRMMALQIKAFRLLPPSSRGPAC